MTCVNTRWGVLFNPKLDLMKSHAAENRFCLYYYSGHLEPATRRTETVLTVDTRSLGSSRRPSFVDSLDSDSGGEEEMEGGKVDLLSYCLRTK